MKIELYITMKIVIKNIFAKLMFNIKKNYVNFIMITIFTKKLKIRKAEKFLANLYGKKEYICSTYKKLKSKH